MTTVKRLQQWSLFYFAIVKAMNEQCYYRISIKGIVVDEDGRILLSREENGMWEMLGGGIDHGEDPVACLKREIMEETGLEVTYVSPSPTYFITSPRIDHVPAIYVANVVYEIKLKDLNFTPSDECQELRFFSVAEMEKADLFPNIQKLLGILKSQ
jgi:8-oxo-dGTP diphosphatase